ncbi:unnamed protein product [Arabis nemorensis]|uniref:Bifunctional inhibitor/plant lipid transfer protein/seed storage helical domain-containing protein n=1 Tax=Arabis nemorensis TaxID=586526 RepID=A0A565ALP0_9BRAS|nr:unnamed protein product [Arabis nemorensis]
MKFTSLVCISFVVVAVIMSSLAPTKAALVRGSEKVACVASELNICVPAAEAGTKPSAECCAKLKEQESCLCGYSKDPKFSQYISSGGARKVLAACGVPYPSCN